MVPLDTPQSPPPFTPRRVMRQRRRTLLIAGLTGVVVAVVLVVATILLASRSDNPDIHLGDDVFVVGKATALVGPIERNGPLLFQDLVGKDLDIFVQHTGADPEEGWVAFDARLPGAARTCQLLWRAPQRAFQDPCSRKTVSADGTGLRRYMVTVRPDGRVVVDFRAVEPAS